MQLQHPIRLIPAALLLAVAPAAFAQSSVTIYGVVDVYTAYQKSTVGGKDTSLWAMGNNGQMTSRLGFKGVEDLGGGYRASFNLETGFDPSTGGLQNSYRYFDRQSWVGLGGGFGEVRVGRQNSVMFLYSGNMDAFGAATYGSAYNNFANWLARVDNDVSYISPRFPIPRWSCITRSASAPAAPPAMRSTRSACRPSRDRSTWPAPTSTPTTAPTPTA